MIEVALINVLDSFSKYSNHDLSYLSGSSYYISIIRIDKIPKFRVKNNNLKDNLLEVYF